MAAPLPHKTATRYRLVLALGGVALAVAVVMLVLFVPQPPVTPLPDSVIGIAPPPRADVSRSGGAVEIELVSGAELTALSIDGRFIENSAIEATDGEAGQVYRVAVESWTPGGHGVLARWRSPAGEDVEYRWTFTAR